MSVFHKTMVWLGLVDDESGGEDDDWYSSFFQPYRYSLARVPFFPAIGNHDTADTEGSDDRAQLEDNFHVQERFGDDPDRASRKPGLFYRLRYGRAQRGLQYGPCGPCRTAALCAASS